MQILNLDQQCNCTCDRANEQKKQTFALEEAHDEIALLREQVTSLQQYLYEQMGQPTVEQELHETKQELKRMNLENQQLLEERLLFLKEMNEFARSLSANQGTDRRVLMKLLNKFCDDIAPFEKLDPVEMNSESVAAAFRSNRTSKSGLRAKRGKESNLATVQRLQFRTD